MPYPIYTNQKNSKSQWLGDIPSHWDVKKLKFVATVQPSNVDKKSVDGEPPVLLCNYTDVYKNEYINDRLDFMQATATEDEIKKFSVDIGDVIVTKDSETPGDIAVPACVSEKVNGLVCGYHLTQIKPIDLDGRYLFRLFQSKGFNAQFTVAANGVTRFGLPQYAIANAVTPVPPIDEQTAIARFLDYKTAQIDALIAKKQVLLAKLAEKRTALISHAVTKGLDPTVSMKDSGVEWLGEIPVHWNIKRLKHLGETRYGLGEPPDKLDGGIPFIRATDIYRGQIDGSKVQTVDPERVPWSRNPELKAKDILVVRSGAYTGDSAIVPSEWAGSIAGYDMVYTAKNALPEYISLNLLSKHVLNGQIYLAKNRAAQPHLNAEELGEVIIAIPSIDDQQIIVSFLHQKISHIEAQTGKITAAVEKLQEYRSALITHAVTGKIDVRGFVIPETSESTAYA